MSVRQFPNAPLFSTADLLRAINLAHELSSSPYDPRLFAVRAVCQIGKLISAEGGCLQSLRTTPLQRRGLSPIHLDGWTPCDDERLAKLVSRRVRCKATVFVKRPENGSRSRPHIYYVTSTRCMRAGEEQVFAFKRLSRPFNHWEQALLQTLHRSMLLDDINLTNCSCDGVLSARKSEVLTHLVSGRSEKQIATELSISRHTVHVYVKALYRRYQVNSRAELIARSITSIQGRNVPVDGMFNSKPTGVNHSAAAE